MFGASKAPFGSTGFGATTSAFGAQPATPFGASSGGLFGSKTPAAGTFGTPGFGSTTPSSSGLFGGTSTGSTLFGSKTTQATTGFGFGGTTTSGGLFGGGSSVFQAPQAGNSFVFGQQAASGTTIKFVPPTSSEQAQKSGISMTIKTQNQCITVMEQYKTKSVEELRLEDYTAGRKSGTGLATATAPGTGLFGSQTTSSSTGLFGGTSATTGGFGFGKTATSGGLFGQTGSGTGLFGAKTTSSLFGSTTTTTSAFGFGGTSGGLFGKSSAGTGVFGSTTTTASTGLFGTGFGTSTAPTGTGLFGTTSAFGQPTSQTTSIFGQTSKPSAFGFGTTGTGFGTTSTGGLFGNTSSSGGLFGATAKPTFSFGATGGGFGATSTGGFGTTGFGTTTSSGGLFGTSGGSSLFGNKPTGFGTTAFGATSTGGSLFGGAGTGGTGLGAFGTTQTGAFGGSALVGNVDQSTLAALQQQQLIQQQIKALANTPFGDSPLFRNLTESSKAKSTQNVSNINAKEALNTAQYKVLSRPATRVKPRPLSSPSLGKSRLFEGIEEEGDFSPHLLVPRKSVKKLIIKNKSHIETDSPFEEGEQKLRLRTDPDDDLVAPSPEVVKAVVEVNDSPTNNAKRDPFIDTISELNNVESTPLPKGRKDYVLTPLPTSSIDASIAEVNDIVLNEEDEDTLPKCKAILKRPEYYTKPPLSELDAKVNEEHCQCLVHGFIVGREGYGEVKFLGVTDVYGLNIDAIVKFYRKEIEVYVDDYANKPEVGKELNKPAEVTLWKVWPSDKTSHAPVKTPERLKESGFIDRLEEKTAALDAVFIDYRPNEGAWVFKVNHFTRYGLQEEFIDDGLDVETRKRLAQGKLNIDPLQKLAAGSVDFQKDDIDITKEVNKFKASMQIDEVELSQDDDSQMEDNDNVYESLVEEEEDYCEMEDFLPASHQLSRVADVQPFNLQGMKTSILYDEDEDEIAATKVKKKKTQIFSNKNIFSNSFAESPKTPFPKLELSSSVHVQDPLNSSVFQNISLNQTGQSKKFQKKTHLFQDGVVNKCQPAASIVPDEDSDCGKAVECDDNLFIKCQTYNIVPYEQSLLFGKTSFLADSALAHSREFNVRWCNNMKFVHTGKHSRAVGNHTKKMPANIFTSNFVSPTSMFGLANSKVSVEKLEKDAGEDFKKFIQDCLEISLQNTEFLPASDTLLKLVKLKIGVDALADYTEKSKSYKLATVSPDYREFLMHSRIWDLVSALWGKQDDDVDSSYEIHSARRASFSNWLSSVVDEDIQAEIDNNKTKDEGHLSTIFSLLSANKIQSACQVARENKELRLAFLLSQVAGDYHLKNYMRSQLCLWEEMGVDEYMNVRRLKLYVLLSGMMVWKSLKSSASINICENVSWKRCLALHVWYHCAPSATITHAFQQYQNAFKGTDTYERYASFPSPDYTECGEVEDESKDICYHIISLYCKCEHSLEKLLSPKTYTAAPLDYHLSWHLHSVLHSLGYTHLSEEKHTLLQHSYAAELELVGLWYWAVFVLMHLRDDARREYCVKELLNRYCRVSDDEEDVLKLTEGEQTIIDKFHVPVGWIHEAKALHAKFVGRHYDESLHLMRAGHWNDAHTVVLKHLTCDAIIEEDYDVLKNLLSDLSLPERCCTIKNWRVGGQVFFDYILLKEKLDDVRANKNTISSYHLEDLEGEVASIINRIKLIKPQSARERLCQSEMARNCSSMQKFVLSFANVQDGEGDSSDDTPKWSSMKVAPYIVDLPLPPDYYLRELRELLENYANEIEASEIEASERKT